MGIYCYLKSIQVPIDFAHWSQTASHSFLQLLTYVGISSKTFLSLSSLQKKKKKVCLIKRAVTLTEPGTMSGEKIKPVSVERFFFFFWCK